MSYKGSLCYAFQFFRQLVRTRLNQDCPIRKYNGRYAAITLVCLDDKLFSVSVMIDIDEIEWNVIRPEKVLRPAAIAAPGDAIYY
jgi:hypothetical protein